MTDFERYFAVEFQRELELVVIPREEMHRPEDGEPSWDRKAAWLLWREREGRVQDEVNRSYEVEEEEWLRSEASGPVFTEDGY